MRKAFYKTIQSHGKDLAKYSAEVSRKFEPGAIHELRTTYKKLRALLRWQKANKNIYTAFRKTYHLAGEMRAIQLAKEMIAKDKGAPRSFTMWLSYQLKKKKLQWNNLYSEKFLHRMQRHLDDPDVSIALHKKFFHKRSGKINKIINAVTIADEALHEIRKMIKDMQYVAEFCNGKIKHPVTKSFTITWLKAVGKQIGSFNDTRMLSLLLADFVKQRHRRPLSKDAYFFIDKWARKKEMQKKRLVKKLKGIDWLGDGG